MGGFPRFPGFSGCAQCLPRVLVNEGGKQESQRGKAIIEAEVGVMQFLALEMKEGTKGQRMQAPPEAVKITKRKHLEASNLESWKWAKDFRA